MARFSNRSKLNLAQCHIDLQTIFREVIKSFDCSIICGHRNQTAQMIAYEAGKSQLNWPDSKHNSKPSMAVDAPPYPIDWHDRETFVFFAGYVKGTANELFKQGKISHRIRWGGDWDSDNDLHDQTFNDLPHFELIRAE